MKKTNLESAKAPQLYERIRIILDSARTHAARSVNTAQVMANWLVGREIINEDQSGSRRASYGEKVLKKISARLTREFGNGYSVDNLELFRRFFVEYPSLISDALRRKLENETISAAVPRKSDSWVPGKIHAELSWTHYRMLLRVEKSDARSFYEIEAVKNNWSARELERQVSSLFYERLAMSKDKKGLMRLALKGQIISKPADVFKDPVVMEFLDLPASSRLVESKLEQVLIDNLQSFLLEMGKGFAFISRQERVTLEGDHFYVDLVFYHTILKCYILIDLKTRKLTHSDLGQLQFYVNYFDKERRSQGDNPTLGLILCADKNDAVVKYTLGPTRQRKIFASRYKLHLPTEAQLKAEIRRELKEIHHYE